MARFVWVVFNCAFGIPKPPSPVAELGARIQTFQGTEKTMAKIYLGVMFWALWKTRNKTWVEHVMPGDPKNVIFHICY
jgi:hypothetical protein